VGEMVLGVGRVQFTEALAVLSARDFQGMLRPIQSGVFPYLRSGIPSRIPPARGSQSYNVRGRIKEKTCERGETARRRTKG
jgi:hypothetical protein